MKTLEFKNGVITGDKETLELIRKNPVRGGKGVTLTISGNIIAPHGIKRMPVVRNRSDGAEVGQVYVLRNQHKGVVTRAKLESGEDVSFILADVGGEETFVFPATKRNTAGKYMEAGYMCGLSPAAMAWQFGIKDPKFADIVRKLLTVIHPAVADGYMHRISWPDSPAEVPTFVPPPHQIFKLDCPWGWIPVSERYGLSVVHDSATKWQKVLGWKGNDGAAAAYQCQKSMHNRIGVYAVRWWGGMFVSNDMTPDNPDWEV